MPHNTSTLYHANKQKQKKKHIKQTTFYKYNSHQNTGILY